MNILFIKHFFVGFMVSEIPRVSVLGYFPLFISYIKRILLIFVGNVSKSRCLCHATNYIYVEKKISKLLNIRINNVFINNHNYFPCNNSIL